MTMTTLATLLLSISALLLSIAALAVALRSSDRSLHKRFVELLMRFQELETAVESQQGKMKSLSVRLSNATHAKQASNGERALTSPTTEEEKDAWQREMNLQIALGKIKVR